MNKLKDLKCQAKVFVKEKVNQYLSDKKENGLATVEMVILLVIVCILGFALYQLKDIILAGITKVGTLLKNIFDAIPS